MTKLDHALAWADRGYGVFPLKPNGKEPLLPGGHNNATRNVAEITRLWTLYPDANIGYSPGSNGCLGIDLDLHAPDANGVEAWDVLLAEHGQHPATLTISTPSGGLHLLFKGTIEQNSVSLLAPGIDTRGSRGYLVAPGSTIDGRSYTVEHDPEHIVELPEWVSGKFAAHEAKRVRRTSDYRGELDSDPDIRMALFIIQEELAEHGALPAQGHGSDARTYNLAVRLLDYAITEQTVTALMHGHWAPHFDLEWLYTKVENATSYRINDQAIKTANVAEEFKPLFAGQQIIIDVRPSRFRLWWPDEFEALPDLQFWDDEKTLPRSPDGAIGLLGGDYGSYKTTAAMAMVLDAIGRGARVVYAAGEGAHGLGKQRIPAYCAARGITTASLRDKLAIVRGVPLFANEADVKEFIEELRAFAPNIIILDTLATVTAGQDENGAIASAYLTDNGPAGRIKRAFNALVLLPAHFGKDQSKGIRGHSGFGGNVDFILEQTLDKGTGAIKQYVEKMRDGADGFSVYYKVPPKGSDEGVPIPVKITKEEYEALSKGGPDDDRARAQVFATRRDILMKNNCFTFETGWDTRKLAEAIVRTVSRVAGTDKEDEAALLETAIMKEKKALENARGKPAYKDVIAHQRVPREEMARELIVTQKMQMVWRWYVDDPQRPCGGQI